MKNLAITAIVFTTVLLAGRPVVAETREDARLVTAVAVLQELRATPDQGIPSWLLQRAYGVAVIPDVIKGAMIFGGRHGNGVLSVRDDAGRYSNPVFISLTGGSFGWQYGAESSDVVLVFATRRSVENFAQGQFTLGASASVAAGPLGRQGEASAGRDAEIYSYSRSRGLFVGAALDGTVLHFERGANRSFYGRDVTADDITKGMATTNSAAARRLIAELAESTPVPAAGASAPATTTPATTTPAGAAPAPAQPAAAPDSGAKSFPLEDRKPGGEPR